MADRKSSKLTLTLFLIAKSTIMTIDNLAIKVVVTSVLKGSITTSNFLLFYGLPHHKVILAVTKQGRIQEFS